MRPPHSRWRRDLFDRLVRETVTDRPVTGEVQRSGYVVWRWWAVLLAGGVEIDERLCLTRRGAARRASRMVAEERARVDAQLDAMAVELFGGVDGG